jgi:ATP-dependent Clp protease ATP-binding subunit ClpA
LIGISKVVDLDLPSLVSKDTAERDAILEELLREVRRVRTVFRTAGVDACILRRRLRRSCEGSREASVPKGPLHRSQASKDVFADAEHFAEITGTAVYPIHLLYALLLAKDTDRDDVVSDAGINRKRFQDAAKRETLFGRDFKVVGTGSSKAKLN